jgi:hypothetical protein
MFLSPLAQPFEPMEFAIFNDGVPSSVFYGSHPDHDVIWLISDEAIDELFPPSAEEVRLLLLLFVSLHLCALHINLCSDMRHASTYVIVRPHFHLRLMHRPTSIITY